MGNQVFRATLPQPYPTSGALRMSAMSASYEAQRKLHWPTSGLHVSQCRHKSAKQDWGSADRVIPLRNLEDSAHHGGKVA